MKPWAERFYNSDAWRSCRDSFLKSKGYLCERCSTPDDPVTAKIAHHKTYLTKQNINDPYIALSWDNLEALCQDCHNKEHKAVHTPMRYQYDANGNLLPPKENNKSDHTPGVQNLTPGKRTEGVTSKKLRKVARI
jgi:5-methylcytosine-specific restriction endonuclease McrA